MLKSLNLDKIKEEPFDDESLKLNFSPDLVESKEK